MSQSTRIAAVLLTAVAIAHLARVVLGIEATVAGSVVPMWVSVGATIVAGGVAFMLWRDRR
jgi:predicted phage tail protein